MFIYNGREKASKHRKGALVNFMGVANPEDARAAWEQAYVTFLTTPVTADTLQAKQALADNLVKHFTTWSNKYKEEILAAFLNGEEAKAAKLRASFERVQKDVEKAQLLKAHVERFIAAEIAAVEATRPSDETIEKLGYDLDKYGTEGYYSYGDDWFYKPGAENLFADEAFLNPICPECGCSGLSWRERCKCEDEACGCSEENF